MPETGVIDLLKCLRSNVCGDSRSDLRRVLSVYERLLSPRKSLENSVQHELLEIRAKLLTCGEHADVVDVVDRMDQVVERCLRLEKQLQLQSVEAAVPIGDMMRLVVALAGGKDGETFVLEDPMQFYDAGKKRIGYRIRMNDVDMVQRSETLFSKAPVALEEKSLFSHNLFNSVGNGILGHHVSLWCSDTEMPDNKELLNMMPIKQRNSFFSLPDNPQNERDHGLMQFNDTHKQERVRHASTCATSMGRVKGLLPKSEVFFYDSTQEVHCTAVHSADWGEASSITENSSWDSDSSLDITEPWIARTYAWEDLGDRMGLPEGYHRPPPQKARGSLHDLVISTEFVSKNCIGKVLLEVHEADLIEDSLRALNGIDSTIFRRHIQSATFQLPRNHRLKLRSTTVAATLSVLEVFRQAGTTLMRLELLAIYYAQDSSRGGKTLQAMGNALLLYLSMHRTFVETIAQQCLSSSGVDQENQVVSVTKVLSKTRKVRRVVEIIGHVFQCDEDEFWPLLQQGKFPRGVALLNHLHDHVSSLLVEDATGDMQELMTWFLVKTCSPLLNVLSDLISSGKVDQSTDPFDEFKVTTWSRHLLERAAARGGDGLFDEDVAIDAIPMLPVFLEEIAPLIVHLSQVQALLRSVNAIASTHPLVNLQPLTMCTRSHEATEYTEKWQSIIDEVMAFQKDLTHADSTEAHDVSNKVPVLAEEDPKRHCERENIKAKRDAQLQQKNLLDQQIWEKKQHELRLEQEENAKEVRVDQEAKKVRAEQEAHGREVLLNKYSALMNDAEERHDYMKWRRDRAVRLSSARDQLQRLYEKDVEQWTLDKTERVCEPSSGTATRTERKSFAEEDGSTIAVTTGIGKRLPIAASEELSMSVLSRTSVKVNEETGSCGSVSSDKSDSMPSVTLNEEAGSHCVFVDDNEALERVKNVSGNCDSTLEDVSLWRASVKVNTQAGSRNSGIFKSSTPTDVVSYKTGVRISKEPGGSGALMYEALYGKPDEVPTLQDTRESSSADTFLVPDAVKMMEESNQLVNPTTDSMTKEQPTTMDTDVEMHDVALDEEEARSWKSQWDEKLSSKANEHVGEVAGKSTRVALPPVHPFFSTAIPQEDSETLTRALTENTSEADFIPFSLLIDCSIEIPVRLVSQKLEQVAMDWVRDSLHVLEHLRWLRKLMLMSEGLCMDIFARDFFLGLNSSARVNWGVEDRLSSALTLAMIEGFVPLDDIAQSFHYKTSAALSQVLSSLTMTPTLPSLLSEIELVYDVKWPLGLVVTSRSLSDYKQMHQFLLHVRLTSLETCEAWKTLRAIRQQRQLSSALERLCGGVIYRTQAFLRAFNETFGTKVLMSAWSELEHAAQKATTLTELRCCHEDYVSVALSCCYLDTPGRAVRSAISDALAAVWKLTALMRGLKQQVAEQASSDTCIRALCDKLDAALRALAGSLHDVTQDGERNAREFSECLLLRLNFNEYYRTDIPVAAAATRRSPGN